MSFTNELVLLTIWFVWAMFPSKSSILFAASLTACWSEPILNTQPSEVCSIKDEPFSSTTSEEIDVPEITVADETEPQEEIDDGVVVPTYKDNANYIGTITIPKINLKAGFVSMNSKENDVDKHVAIMPTSTYPDVALGNFILAAHSGRGKIAYFNDLYQLNVGDTATIEYQGKNYTYQIVNIYQEKKTGKVAIHRNFNKTTLTLITCTNNNSKTQTVYIAELING